MFTTLLAVALVVVPSVYGFWTSRGLRRDVRDPLFAERVSATTTRIGSAAGLSIGVALLLTGPYRMSVVLLVILGGMAGWFPARRRIFDESWGFLGYLWHTARLWIAELGGICLVACLPWVVHVFPRFAVVSGIAVGALALAWTVFNAQVYPWILGARSLDDVDLEEPFAAVLSKSERPPPRLYRIGVRGGRFINAVAATSLSRSSVLLSDGLLEALTRDEASAVFAHEVAHLEHHDRKYLLNAYAVFFVIAALPIFLWAGPFAAHAHGWEWLWPLALFLFMLHAGREHRSHETESDVRAVELCGNPEALVSALSKIHTLSHVPKRWSDEFEQVSTHPSLARRVKAIREAAGQKPDPPRAPIDVTVVVSPLIPRKAVVLDSTTLHWLVGFSDQVHANANAEELLAAADERRSIRYGELRELRLESLSDEQRLSFCDQSGRVTKMPVAVDDVARLETLLDRLDSELGYAAEPLPSLGRWWSFVVTLFGLTTSLSLLLLGGLALAIPSQASLAAAGIGAVATAAGELARAYGWDGPLPTAELAVFPSLCLGYAGLMCLSIAWKRHRRQIEQRGLSVWLVGAVPVFLGLVSLASSTAAFGSGDVAMRLHQWARYQPDVAIYALAAAVTLATLRNRAARAAAATAVLAASSLLFAGTREFRSSFTSGPFAGHIEELSVRDASMTPVRTISLDVESDEILALFLSPAGTRLAYERLPDVNPYESAAMETTYFVERAADDFVRVEGLTFRFIDEASWAVVTVAPGGLVLQEMGEDGAARIVADKLPPLTYVTLSVDHHRGLWRAEGFAHERSELVVIQGSFDARATKTLRFRYDEEPAGAPGVVTPDGRMLETAYHSSEPQAQNEFFGILPLLLSAQGPPISMSLELRTPAGVSKQLTTVGNYVSCLERPLDEHAIYCLASNLKTSELWAFTTAEERFEPIGILSGGLYAGNATSTDEIVLSSHDETLVVTPTSRSAIRLLVPGLDRSRSDADWSASTFRDGKFAVSSADPETGASKVTVYELNEP